MLIDADGFTFFFLMTVIILIGATLKAALFAEQAKKRKRLLKELSNYAVIQAVSRSFRKSGKN